MSIVVNFVVCINEHSYVKLLLFVLLLFILPLNQSKWQKCWL